MKELVLRHLLNLEKLGVLCMYLGAENVTLALELVAYTEEIQVGIFIPLLYNLSYLIFNWVFGVLYSTSFLLTLLP